jgi:hypothetical protein
MKASYPGHVPEKLSQRVSKEDFALLTMSRHDKVDIREQAFYAVLTPLSRGGCKLSG